MRSYYIRGFNIFMMIILFQGNRIKTPIESLRLTHSDSHLFTRRILTTLLLVLLRLLNRILLQVLIYQILNFLEINILIEVILWFLFLVFLIIVGLKFIFGDLGFRDLLWCIELGVARVKVVEIIKSTLGLFHGFGGGFSFFGS